MNSIPYRSLMGNLMYLSCHTRPDISYSVGVLARYITEPAVVHWTASNSSLRYLRGTSAKGIIVGDVGSESVMTAFSDSDWVGDKSDRKSTGAYIVLLNGGISTWKISKQKCVAASSTEAEYISLSNCVREVQYARNLLS